MSPFFFLCQTCGSCQLYWSIQKTISLFYWFFSFVFLFSISMISALYYFIPSACFRFILLIFFLVSLYGHLIFDFGLFLFLNICTWCYRLLPQHCFSNVPQILICLFLFSLSSKYFKISLWTSLSLGLFGSLLFSFQVGDFSLIIFLLISSLIS